MSEEDERWEQICEIACDGLFQNSNNLFIPKKVGGREQIPRMLPVLNLPIFYPSWNVDEKRKKTKEGAAGKN